MSDHIDIVKRAIEFRKPEYLPMEIVDVPGVYNAYNTQDPESVKFIPGTENFDALWTNCYSWFHETIGRTEQGETLKRDQFGVVIKTPVDEGSAYHLVKHPLAGKSSLAGYQFPDPAAADPVFDRLGRAISARYHDRFVEGFIDAGIFLTCQLLTGIEEFMFKVAAERDFIIELYRRVAEYYKGLIPRYKRAGAHMITVIEDIGGTSSLVISPKVWREHFKPILKDFIDTVHSQGMYAGLAIDGHAGDALDDVAEMGVDCYSVFDIHTTGLDLIRRKLSGKVCVKAAVDMQRTLPSGTPEQVATEARKLVETLSTKDGGFIAQVVRWRRPEFPAANVAASVRAFNEYRKIR